MYKRQQLGRDLARDGYTIVSGGAEGIDKCAHEAALSVHSPTMAVLACGADVPYPAKHERLFHRIRATGAVITEYGPGTPPARHRFLTRNRLAAALGQATVVVQAPIRSGALNTLNWCEAMAKIPMAVPGPITSAGFQGCLDRLKTQRAEMVTSSVDVRSQLEPLGHQLEMDWGSRTGERPMTLNELTVFDSLPTAPGEGGTIEMIQAETGLSGKVVMRSLRSLDKAGMIVREGTRWVKSST